MHWDVVETKGGGTSDWGPMVRRAARVTFLAAQWSVGDPGIGDIVLEVLWAWLRR